jgi:CRISPR-associated endonuclease/helicase Cas3
MLNVGRVAQCLAGTVPELLDRFNLKASVVGSLAALHDLGKITPGFQRKCSAWLVAHGLENLDRQCGWGTTTESSHAKVTHAAVQKVLLGLGVDSQTAACLATVLGAHHGRIQAAPDSRPFRPVGVTESRSGIGWEEERDRAARAVLQAFGTNPGDLYMAIDHPSMWWLAGLTTVADWIGSDEQFFAPGDRCEEPRRMLRARQAIQQLCFGQPCLVAALGFAELFGFPPGSQPNDMQIKARERIQGPGVYVIEAPMGMGKTEAALWVAYELMLVGKARGIYFALPTQATSNRIHVRMEAFVHRIAPGSGSSRLIHGNSWLYQEKPDLEPAPTASGAQEDARAGGDWFASGKRALLAPFGVGTVDQALLAVVAAKHFFVRHFALAGKVVILDEVHSYDLYTGTLIDRLVEVLPGLGCTVIILSATLTRKRRDQLVPSAADPDADPQACHYPMISSAPESGAPGPPLACKAPPSRRVSLVFLQRDAALAKALELARQGGVVLWIFNTVQAAQEQYLKVREEADEQFPVGLLHSRFPFWRREELEDEWMTRLGKGSLERCGCILVSTQIVEQSVDLDADLLITELAPTDMLFQRMGRLWRHERPDRMGSPTMILLEESEPLEVLLHLGPKAIVQSLGAKAFVYSPYILLRTLEVWHSRDEVLLPDHIRPLIEATYAEREVGSEPAGWREMMDPESWGKLFDERYALDLSRKFLATRNTHLWQPILEDVEGAQTRLNEMPTVQLVLCQSLAKDAVVFLDGTRVQPRPGQHAFATAQAIHRNGVKVPRHHFAQVVPWKAFEACRLGEHTVGRVVDGLIELEGLKQGVRLRWSRAEGVVVEQDSPRSRA